MTLKQHAIVMGFILSLLPFYSAAAQKNSKTNLGAVEVVNRPLDLAGKEGFASLYTLSRDIPSKDIEKVLQTDVALFGDGDGIDAKRQKLTLEQYRSIVNKDEKTPWCHTNKDCLALVRSDLGRYSSLVLRNKNILKRAENLSAFDQFISPFPMVSDTPIPQYTGIQWLTTKNALAFAQGNTEEGMDGACKAIHLGRSLVGGSNLLISSMVGASLIKNSGALLNQMLDEIPENTQLPRSCQDVFSSSVDTSENVCRAVRSEGQFALNSTDHLYNKIKKQPSQGYNMTDATVYNHKETLALIAQDFSWFCGDQAKEQIAQNGTIDPKTVPKLSLSSKDCQSNQFGCAIATNGTPVYVHYANRVTEADTIFTQLKNRIQIK